MIKAVLQVQPQYLMSCFLPSAKISNHLTQILMNYWWSNNMVFQEFCWNQDNEQWERVMILLVSFRLEPRMIILIEWVHN